jgi:hypothetical protein
MKNKLSLTLKGLFLIFSVLACSITINTDRGNGETIRGSGTMVEETRTVGGVSDVELAMPGTLHITMGDKETFRIEAEDNLMAYIQTNVRAGKLLIQSRPGTSLRPTRPIDYYLTVTELSSIVISSDGDIETGDLQSDSFSITVSSSGNASISTLNCTSLSVKISSSGNVKVSELMANSISVDISSSGNLEIQKGKAQQQDINISSSGEYRARDLESVSANAILTSSGEATIRVSEHLTGSLSSSGNINYVGSPEVDVRMTSSGRTVQISR